MNFAPTDIAALCPLILESSLHLQHPSIMSEEVFNSLSEPDYNAEDKHEAKDGGLGISKEDVWTVSTKTRRLAPAFTLSRKDLGADSARNTTSLYDTAAVKKKGNVLRGGSPADEVSFFSYEQSMLFIIID